MNKYLISYAYWRKKNFGLGHACTDILAYSSEKMDETTLEEIKKEIMLRRNLDELIFISFNKLEG